MFYPDPNLDSKQSLMSRISWAASNKAYLFYTLQYFVLYSVKKKLNWSMRWEIKIDLALELLK